MFDSAVTLGGEIKDLLVLGLGVKSQKLRKC